MPGGITTKPSCAHPHAIPRVCCARPLLPPRGWRCFRWHQCKRNCRVGKGGKVGMAQARTQEGREEVRAQAEPVMQEEWGAPQEVEGQVGPAYFKGLRREAAVAALLQWEVLPP